MSFQRAGGQCSDFIEKVEGKWLRENELTHNVQGVSENHLVILHINIHL